MSERTRTLTPRADAIQEPPKRVKSDALVWLYADSLKQLARQLETELSAPSQAVTLLEECLEVVGQFVSEQHAALDHPINKEYLDGLDDLLLRLRAATALRSAPPSSQQQSDMEHLT